MISAARPAKPSPDFPLFPHASGKWAKKIKGKLVYFGRWDDPAGALAAYQALSAPPCDTVSQAQPARQVARGTPLIDVLNAFLESKSNQVQAGELARKSLTEYIATCKWFLSIVGSTRTVESLTPADFDKYRLAVAKKRNIVGVGNEVTRVKVALNWVHKKRLISQAVHFGPDFRKPSAKALRKHKRLAGPKLFSREQIHMLLHEAGLHMRAMILLGVNCGFGNTDVATMPIECVDLDRGWIHYPRPKTEVDRLVPLWPETVAALKASAECRYEPRPEAEGRFFVMPNGRAWDNVDVPLGKRFRQIAAAVGIGSGGFYTLRHVFATVAGGSKDQVAVNAIMGHVDPSMAATYREEIAEERLVAVTDHVHGWLFR